MKCLILYAREMLRNAGAGKHYSLLLYCFFAAGMVRSYILFFMPGSKRSEKIILWRRKKKRDESCICILILQSKYHRVTRLKKCNICMNGAVFLLIVSPAHQQLLIFKLSTCLAFPICLSVSLSVCVSISFISLFLFPSPYPSTSSFLFIPQLVSHVPFPLPFIFLFPTFLHSSSSLVSLPGLCALSYPLP